MAKTFLCLGAGPGIGLSTAARFAKEGYEVTLVSRSAERLKNLADGIKARTGMSVRTFAADAGDADQVMKLADVLGPVDVVHFNAAVIHELTLEKASYATLHDDIRIGITGALYALKAFAPAMLDRRFGTFLLTGGMLADNPMPQYLTLGIAKAGIKNMAQALFAAFRERNVHIATVTVCAAVAPNSREAEGVAEAFWELSQQPAEDWSWEKEYKAVR